MSLQEQLKELNQADSHVRGLRKRMDAAMRRLHAQQQKLDQLKQQHQELTDQHRHTQTKQRELEQQAQQTQEQIETHRRQMNEITNNKQYSAMLVEISNLKNEKSRLEEQALERMNEVEAIRQRQAEVEQKRDEQQKLVDQSQEEVQQAQDEVSGRLEEATAERDQALAALPQQTRDLFERLADAYEGEAMAPIEEEDRRRMEYSCGGCFISLPANHVNAVATRPDEITTCPNCHRILYVGEDLKATMKPRS